MVGAVVMTHGDDQGLRLPPKLAPIQVVIVPIFRNDDERGPVMAAVDRIAPLLKNAGIRVHVDKRENLSPGFKFNDWEMRGVPMRMEIGPKDVAKNSVALARRDIPGKAGKEFVSQDGLVETIRDAAGRDPGESAPAGDRVPQQPSARSHRQLRSSSST